MMSSNRSSPPKIRSPRRSVPKSGSFQMVLFLVVAVLVVVIIAIVAFGGKKGGTAKASQEKKSRIRAVAQTSEGSVTKPKIKSSRGKREQRLRRRLTAEEREMRRKRRERATGRVTVRSSRGGYISRRTGKPVLRAIITEPSGNRVAVIGERRVKAGDQIEGRRIIEVGPDRVKVEYFTKAYDVKLNQPLY